VKKNFSRDSRRGEGGLLITTGKGKGAGQGADRYSSWEFAGGDLWGRDSVIVKLEGGDSVWGRKQEAEKEESSDGSRQGGGARDKEIPLGFLEGKERKFVG